MLQTLREKMQGWPAMIVLGIAVFAMAFFGIESYFSMRVDTYVAKVGKDEISQQQFRAWMRQIRQQAMTRQGSHFDGKAFDAPQNRLRMLDAMIDRQLLRQASQSMGMRVPDQALRAAIANTPDFQVNGRFDPKIYRQVLLDHGMTSAMFQREQRFRMRAFLLPRAISESVIVTAADLDRDLRLQLQHRDIRYITLTRPRMAIREVSGDAIASYYKNHRLAFMRPEKVSLQYIQMSTDTVKLASKPSEAALKKLYNDEKSRFVQPERRLVSHILIKLPDHATDAQRQAVLTRANKIATEVTASNFATLAKKNSADLGSRNRGGDLGWLQKGQVSAAFDKALFALKKGQISPPVLSTGGYHIIYVRGIQRGKSRSFADVRPELAQQAIRVMRSRKFNEVAGKLTDASYQTPNSLDLAAKTLRLPIRHTGLFSRQGGKGIAANPRVIAVAFSGDVLKEGNNSSLINLDKNDAVVIRVDRHKPATVRPLSEVSTIIRKKILDARVAALAEKQAHDLLKHLRQRGDMQAVAKSVGATVRTVKHVARLSGVLLGEPMDGHLPVSVRREAFLLPHPEKGTSSYACVALSDGRFAVLAVDQVKQGDPSRFKAARRMRLRQQMIQAYAHTATRSLVHGLRKKTKIQIAVDRM